MLKLNARQTAQLEEAVARLLPRRPARAKATRIQDSIWGSIEVHRHEVALLNTPLLQRLRRIKQLGSAHLVFPGATHTRFEHSLGVLEQTDRMCKGLRQNKHRAAIDRHLLNLRIAALCHDLGHGPFSHYAETVLESLASFRQVKGAAEQISALIVRSRPFVDFCAQLGADIDPLFVARAITGELPASQRYLGEIIHGPFDADKIDYLMRDGLYCGMPIQLDTSQIYRSLTTFRDRAGQQRLAGTQRAAAALIQLARHRQHMFAVVYHHKVSRIFKAMLLNAMRCVQEDRTAVNGAPLRTDFAFLELDDEMLLTPGVVTKGRAADLLLRLRERDLFKQAVEFSGGAGFAKMRQRISRNSQHISDEIAAHAGLAPQWVALDPIPPIKYWEAHKMLIMKDGRPIKLGSILDIKQEGDRLQDFMERDLLCCPAQHGKKVARAAHKVLGRYVLG